MSFCIFPWALYFCLWNYHRSSTNTITINTSIAMVTSENGKLLGRSASLGLVALAFLAFVVISACVPPVDTSQQQNRQQQTPAPSGPR
jgi:hypothetical protein